MDVVPLPLPLRYRDDAYGREWVYDIDTQIPLVLDVTGELVRVDWVRRPPLIFWSYLKYRYWLHMSHHREVKLTLAWAPPPWIENYEYHKERGEALVYHGSLPDILVRVLGSFPSPHQLLHPDADNSGLCLFPVYGPCPRKLPLDLL